MQARRWMREVARPFKVVAGRVIIASVLVWSQALPTAAAPTGAQVQQGNVQIEQSGALTRITASNGSIIHFQTFDIAAHEAVRFVQPGADARVLNRVLGGSPSQIHGVLSANGQVYLLNEAGVFFGPTAVVDAARLYAGAARMSDADFAAGVDRFTDVKGTVVNQGFISADEVHLFGRAVVQAGEVRAPAGFVTLSVGDEVMISRVGDRLHVRVTAPEDTGGAQAPDPAKVLDDLAAGIGAGDLYGLALHGNSALEGAQVRMTSSGSATLAGRIDAPGGDVAVVAKQIDVVGATIDASGDTGGGTVHIGERGVTQSVRLDAATTVHADALHSGDGGEVIVWGDDTARFAGLITARALGVSGDGGFAEVSAQKVHISGHADLRSTGGEAGVFLIDPAELSIIRDDDITIGDGADPNVFSDTWVNNQLDTSTTLLLQTTAPVAPGDPERITVGSGIVLTVENGQTLQLDAPEIVLDGTIGVDAGGVLNSNGAATTVVLNTGGALDNAVDLLVVGPGSLLQVGDGVDLPDTLVMASADLTVELLGSAEFGGLAYSAGTLTVGGGETLTLDASSALTASLSVTGDLVFADLALNAASISAGNVAVGGTLTLGQNATITAADVALDAVGGAFGLTVNASGTTTFGGAVNIAALTTDAPGLTQVAAGSITTTGNQTFGDPVTVSGATTLAGDNIAFADDLTVNAATNANAATAATFGGTVVLNDALGVTGTVNGASLVQVGLTGSYADGRAVVALPGTIELLGNSYAEVLTLDDPDLTVELAAGLTQFTGLNYSAGTLVMGAADTLELSGASTLAGNLTVAGAIDFAGLSVNGATALSAGQVSFGGLVTLNDVFTLGGTPIGTAAATVDVGVGGRYADGRAIVALPGTIRMLGNSYGEVLTLDNAGLTVELGAGVTQFAGLDYSAGTLTLGAADTLRLTAASTLDGNLAVLGSLIFDGTVVANTPTLTAGDLTFNNTLTLNEPFALGGGTTLVAGAPTVRVGGTATYANGRALVRLPGTVQLLGTNYAEPLAIDNAGLTVQLASGTTLFQGLNYTAGALNMGGGDTLQLTAPSTLSANLAVAGSLVFDSTVLVNATALTASNVSFNDTVTLNQPFALGGGTTVLLGAPTVEVGPASTYAGARSIVRLPGTIQLSGNAYAEQLVLNDPGLTVQLAAGASVFQGLNYSAGILAMGGADSLQLAGGSSTLASDLTVAGSLVFGTPLSVVGDTALTAAAVAFNNPVTLDATFTLGGGTVLAGGAPLVTVQDDGRYVDARAIVLLPGGQIDIAAGIHNELLLVDDADLTVNVLGNATFAGLDYSAGTFSVVAGQTLTLSAPSTVTAAINVPGSIVFDGLSLGAPITADTLSFGATTLTANAAITGNSVTLGGLISAAGFDLTVTGPTTLSGAGVQNADDLLLMSPVTLAGSTTLAGNRVELQQTVGGTHGLTIQAINALLGGPVTIGSLDVTGASLTLNAGTVTTTGDQTYNTAVTSGMGLALNTGGLTRLLQGANVASLTTDAGGTTVVGGNVITAGGQLYGDNVSLATAVALSGGSVQFNGTVSGAALTVNSVGGGVTSFNGPVNVSALQTNADGQTVLNTGSMQSAGALRFDDALTINTDATLTSLGGSVILSGPTMVAGGNDLSIVAEDVTLSPGAIVTGSGGDLTFRTATASRIILLGGGGGALVLDQNELNRIGGGWGEVVFDLGPGNRRMAIDAAGATIGRAVRIVGDAGDLLVLRGDFAVTGGDLTVGPRSRVEGNAAVRSTAGDLAIQQSIDGTTFGADNLALQAGGDVTLVNGGQRANIGSGVRLGSVTATANRLRLADVTTSGGQTYAAGQIQIGSTYATQSGSIAFSGPVVLLGDSTVVTGGGAGADILFGSTIDGPFNLLLDANDAGVGSRNAFGKIVFRGDVGGTTPLASLSVNTLSATRSSVVPTDGTILGEVPSGGDGELDIRAGAFMMGQNEKFVVRASSGAIGSGLGGLEIATGGGDIVVGDISTDGNLTLNAGAGRIRVLSRAAAPIAGNGITFPDEGVDYTAVGPGSVVTFVTDRPIQIDGAFAAPGFALDPTAGVDDTTARTVFVDSNGLPQLLQRTGGGLENRRVGTMFDPKHPGDHGAVNVVADPSNLVLNIVVQPRNVSFQPADPTFSGAQLEMLRRMGVHPRLLSQDEAETLQEAGWTLVNDIPSLGVDTEGERIIFETAQRRMATQVIDRALALYEQLYYARVEDGDLAGQVQYTPQRLREILDGAVAAYIEQNNEPDVDRFRAFVNGTPELAEAREVLDRLGELLDVLELAGLNERELLQASEALLLESQVVPEAFGDDWRLLLRVIRSHGQAAEQPAPTEQAPAATDPVAMRLW